ncbi:DNA polymerase III subunit gamma/tau [Paraburkholderia bonniea]|uniref:DNA polymerase III subunit gamma/tau n=1 Tax=Paraburkholderia bonniea TaxID=2152891 RepID=UPI001291F3AC|nr:DNA polymerase III subunit gamma/tau [Paraburkholderia bonniea]
MTYQVLARKWRPKDFASLVGQEHVVRALTHALDGGRLHHAYLFTGTRGVGKTTLSRIFAKALNCETGVTSTPCGICRACREIDEGRFVDYVEMDAASNRGVDEMAALLERAVYAPVDARFKVYMIDEVHMLTNHAFNAMLKTLEEPPAHVKFILATTDPQKIPVTVLSRCLQFNLKQMPAGHIVTHLEQILAQEQVSFDVQALRLLARAADGSMRDALSLTDQAIAYSANQVTEEAVCGMLGALDQSYLVRLLDALTANDGAAVLAVADEMALRSLSFSTALQDLASLLHRVAWAQFAPSSVLDEWPEASDVRRFADALTAEHVQLFYQIATIGRSELGLAPDEYAGFTMTLLRMLAFEPASANGTSPLKLERRLSGTSHERMPSLATAKPAPAPAMPRMTVPEVVVTVPRHDKIDALAAHPVSQITGEVADTATATAMPTEHQTRQKEALTGVLVTPVSDQPDDDAEAAPSAALADSAGQSAESIGAATEAEVVPATQLADSAQSASDASLASQTVEPFADKPMIRFSDASTERAIDLTAGIAAPPPAATPVMPAIEASMADATAVASAAPPPPRRAGGASAALDVLRSAGMKVSSGVRPGAAAQSSSAPAMTKPKAAPPRVNVPVPGAARPTAPAGAPNVLEQGTAATPPWDDAPFDDYQPVSPSEAFLSPPDDDYAASFSQSLGPAGNTKKTLTDSAAPPTVDLQSLPVAIVLDAIGFSGDWPSLAASLPLKGIAHQLAFNSELTALDGTTLKLNVAVPQYADTIQVAKLKAALADQLGRAVEVQVEVGPARRTAAVIDGALKAQRQQEAEREIHDDPFIQSLIREFGASVVQDSIRPLAAGAILSGGAGGDTSGGISRTRT